MKNAPLLLLLGIFLIFCNPRAQAQIYGSGVFALNEGAVYSTDGTYIGTGSVTYSGGTVIGFPVEPGSILTLGSYIPPANPPGPHTLTASAINGTVFKTPDQTIYDYGTSVTLNASPLPGYIFKNWTRNGSFYGNASSIISVNAVADSEFVATFELISRILVPDASQLIWAQQQTGVSFSHSLLLRNTGNSPLNITKIVCPPGFTADWSGSLAPGTQQSIPIAFSPTHRGIYAGSIVIESDATAGTTTFPISAGAENVYAVTASSTFTGFGSLGSLSDRSVTKERLSGANLVPGLVAVSVQQTSYSIAETRQYWEGSVVHLQASAVGGYVFRNWTENGQVISNSMEFDLSMAAAHDVQANYDRETRFLQIDSWAAFGPRKVGSTSRRFIRISNTGNSPAFVTGLRFAPRLGDRRSPFSGEWSGWIQPGQVQRVAITFKPTRPKKYRAVVSVEGIGLGDGASGAFLDGRGL